MKLLTLNTHSLEEKDYEKKLKIFTEEILKEFLGTSHEEYEKLTEEGVF